MATYDQGMRGNGRGADHDREDMMRDPETTSWRGGGRDMRGDLDRRTHRDEIDRRHDWHRGGGSPGERFMRGEAGDVPAGGRLQTSPSRPERSFGGGAPSGYGSSQYGSEYWGSTGGYGGATGGYGGGAGYGNYGGAGAGSYGGYETGETMGPPSSMAGGGYGGEWRGTDRGRGGDWRGSDRGSEYGASDWRSSDYGDRGRGGDRDRELIGRYTSSGARGGYGGRNADEYGGSYGGIGPGRDGMYGAAGSFGGPSGAGSLAGTFGETAGWEEERMGMRPGSFALHSMMMEGREPRREEWMGRDRRGRWEREGALVRDVMTKNPKSVHPDSPIHEAARLMREEDTGFIPVVEDGRVLGMVTDRDIALRIVAERKDTNTQVRHVMSTDVHVCTPDDKLTDAVRIMGEENVRRLPVVDRDDHLKGVISMTDVAREAEMDYALQEALEQIAARRSFWSRW